MGAARVEASALSWSFAGQTQRALEGVTVTIEPGERVLLTGPSGSGKSTLAGLLAGVMKDPDDGTLEGKLTVFSEGPRGLVLQQPDDQTVMARVHDDVAFGLENSLVPPGDMAPRITQALSEVGLDLDASHPTQELSGGQRQRLAIAGALAMQPGLLILDEPVSALDPEGIEMVLQTIKGLVADRNITLVVVDHDAARWADIVDRVITLEAGCVVPSVSTPPLLAPLTSTPRRSDQSSSEEIVSARELVISRDGSRALGKPQNVSVHAGEIVALRGPNGSGKTTLAMTLAGILRPRCGSVTILGTDPGSLSSGALSQLVGVVPQNPAHSFFHSSVRAELGKGRADEVATSWGLTGVLDHHPLTLSGGQQRRLALALASGEGQRLLVLDEPSQSLDRAGREQLVANLRDAAERGLAVVLATHDDTLVHELGAREIVLPSSPARHAPARPASILEKANPLSLLGAALIPAIALLSTIDLVSAGVAVAFVLAGLPLVARGVSRLGLRMLPVVLASGFSAITIALYGETSGAMFFEWGLIQVSEGSLSLALATALRIIAIGAPAVLLFSQVDATRFADALAQQARAPENFVVGGLAGLRLLDVVAGDREVREWMVRSRGRGDRGVLRRVASVAFTTFVLAIRRSHTLAMAMEARAFGLHSSRTHFRTSLFPARDYLWIAGGAVVGALSVGAALLTGQFNAILG